MDGSPCWHLRWTAAAVGPPSWTPLGEASARSGLALVGTRTESLRDLAAELNLPADRTLLHVANLRDASAASALARAVTEAFHRMDLLFHLIGGWSGGKAVVEVEPRETEEMFQQHVWTTFYLAHALVPLLIANHWGRIIVVSSPVATQPIAKIAPYAMAKAAQETLILSLAQELAGTGVTANVLQVHSIDTRPERERTPTKASRTTPEEIVAAMLYLSSDPAQVVNGARIPLYGRS